MSETVNRVDEEFINKTRLYGRETPVVNGVSVLTDDLPAGADAVVGINTNIFRRNTALILMTDGQVKGENPPNTGYDILGKDPVFSRRISYLGTHGFERHPGFSTSVETLKEISANAQAALSDSEEDRHVELGYDNTNVNTNEGLTFYAQKHIGAEQGEVVVVRRDEDYVREYSLGTPAQLNAAIGHMERAAEKGAKQR